MKNFKILAVHWKMWLLGVQVYKKPMWKGWLPKKGELGQFADLAGGGGGGGGGIEGG